MDDSQHPPPWTATPPPWTPPGPPAPPVPIAPPAPPTVAYVPVSSIPLGGHPVAPGAPTGPNPPLPLGPPASPYAAVPGTARYTARVVAAPVGRRARLAATFVAIAAGLLAAGTFLPWLEADIEGSGTRSGNGWTNVLGDRTWGPGLLLLALVIAVASAPAIADVRSTVATAMGIVAAALAAVVGSTQLVDIYRDHPGVVVHPGWGAAVVVGSAVVSVVGFVVVAAGGRPAKVSAPRAVGAVG